MGLSTVIIIISLLLAFNVFAAETLMRMRRDQQIMRKNVSEILKRLSAINRTDGDDASNDKKEDEPVKPVKQIAGRSQK